VLHLLNWLLSLFTSRQALEHQQQDVVDRRRERLISHYRNMAKEYREVVRELRQDKKLLMEERADLQLEVKALKEDVAQIFEKIEAMDLAHQRQLAELNKKLSDQAEEIGHWKAKWAISEANNVTLQNRITELETNQRLTNGDSNLGS